MASADDALLEAAYHTRGWCRFAHDPALERWVEQARPFAERSLDDERFARWLRCGGTWFAGVNALPNDEHGAVPGGRPLAGRAVDFVTGAVGLPRLAWDRAQVSVCRPGYPQPMPSESAAAFRYRRVRDAAHVDGLLPEGPGRRRHLREHHAFILGVPLFDYGPGASPFVIWEGSHELVRAALSRRFAGLSPGRWGDEDVTEAYRQVREEVFERCERVTIVARPGEAYVAHRLSVHGMAPWAEDAEAGPAGRTICYFRPVMSDPRAWLELP